MGKEGFTRRPEKPLPSSRIRNPLLITRVLVSCAECGVSVRKDRLRRHIAKLHRNNNRSDLPRIETNHISTQQSKFRELLRPCPHCGASVRADRIDKHLAKVHPSTPLKQLPIKVLAAFALKAQKLARKKAQKLARKMVLPVNRKSPIPVRSGGPILARQEPKRLACPKCSAKVREECMDLHFQSCHSSNDPLRLPTQQLPFVLLPPGSWQIRQVVDHYRSVADKLPLGLRGSRIEWSRLREIESLNPVRCYIGKNSWLGYVVFEFMNSQTVVMECPMEGNATYILTGNWVNMVSHTKAEIRIQFARNYTKVVHKGDWLYRIRQALSQT